MTARILPAIGWLALAMTAIGLGVYASLYLQLAPDAFPFVEQRPAFEAHATAIRLHIFFGIIALVTAPIQLLGPLRRRVPNFHRATGMVYAGAVFASAAAALVVAPHTFGGFSTSAAFATLAVFWAFATAAGVKAAIDGRFDVHRRWMFRSCAMTFAALTLRAELGLLIFAFNVEQIDAYRTVAWACWTLNLIILEWAMKIRARTN